MCCGIGGIALKAQATREGNPFSFPLNGLPYYSHEKAKVVLTIQKGNPVPDSQARGLAFSVTEG